MSKTNADLAGSSPLTRGKHILVVGVTSPHGLIPAHAGKTSRPASGRDDGRAHPRSRGENHPCLVGITAFHGSSPLTRGKPVSSGGAQVGSRLIPAHAGKTEWRSGNCTRGWAHPRSRGENLLDPPDGSPRRGSSPLTRGKRQSPSQTLPYLGLIPAHAGKTDSFHARLASAAAHPRSRGENFSRPKVTPLLPGSSPLTRGKPEEPHRTVGDGGLIPAHAGKTDRRQDHR